MQDQAALALGIMGAVFWSIQLIPQLILNYYRGHTHGVQSTMMLLWAAAGLWLGIYNVLSGQMVALQVQAQILMTLSLLTWGQVMYYGHHWGIRSVALCIVGVLSLFGGIEAAFICGFKFGKVSLATREHFLTAAAVLAAVGLGLGVLRHYYDVYTHGAVRGLSWFFVGLDAAGDLTSMLSVLLRKGPLDKLAVGVYATELALWIGIMSLGLFFNFPVWLKATLRKEKEDPAANATTLEISSLP